MHQIEPFFYWRDYYRAEEDENSPFFGRSYSEFELTNAVNNILIHPQWDSIESETLYLKLLFSDYEIGFAIIELFGDWNDAINNDIEKLFENCFKLLIEKGIDRFILLGENVQNFYANDLAYYAEIIQFIENGWVCCVNFNSEVANEMTVNHIFDYFQLVSGEFIELENYHPDQFYSTIETEIH